MRTLIILTALSASLFVQAQHGVGRIIPDVPPYPGDTLIRCMQTWENMKPSVGLDTLTRWAPDFVEFWDKDTADAYTHFMTMVTNETKGFLTDTTDGHGPLNIMTIYKYTEYHTHAKEMPGYVWFPVDSLDYHRNIRFTMQVLNYHFSPYNPDFKKYKNKDQAIIAWNTGTAGLKKGKRAAGYIGRDKAFRDTHLFLGESGLAHGM